MNTRTTTRLLAFAKRQEQLKLKLDSTVNKLDEQIERMTVERQAAQALAADVMQCLREVQAEIELQTIEDMEMAAELERLSAERERERERQAAQERQAKAERERMERTEVEKQSPLGRFIATNLHEAPGHLLPFGDFYGRFKAWLPPDDRPIWTRVKVSRTLPPRFASGTGNQNVTYIINAAWQPMPAATPYYVAADGRIRRE